MKIDFEFQTPHGIFRDALHLPDNHTLTDVEISALKSERLDNWLAAVTAPPAEESAQEYVEIEGVRYVKVSSNG